MEYHIGDMDAARLLRQGRLTPPRRRLPTPFRPVLPYEPGSPLLSDLVIEMRKEKKT